MSLADYLASCDSAYDEDAAMLRVYWHGGAGYHSQMPAGNWVHPTRDSLAYAQALLMTSEPERHARAGRIVRKLISLQDTNPDHDTYGIWSYLLEEPLEEMAPPDWNWADFCGAILATMLIEHAEKLDSDLQEEMKSSLRHACNAIVRRDVGPDYTNIAVLGAAVTLAGGEILDDPALVAYGRNRLRRIVEYTEEQGGFNEYNSPTYTIVALHETERVAQLVRDGAARQYAETLRRVAWETIATHYHPATGQWAGPHSRAYSDWLRPETAAELAERIGRPLPVRMEDGSAQTTEALGLSPVPFVTPMPCPDAIAPRFSALPEDPYEVHLRVIRRETEAESTYTHTWLTADACLGSVNRDMFWTQRRVLLGYWRTDEDLAVCFRLRFLHDGRDFASATFRGTQSGPRVLSVVGLRLDGGDWHGHLDKPGDNRFRATDFRVRYQLAGRGVRVETLGEGRFVLSAGTRRVVVHALPATFGEHAVRWETGQEDGVAYVDGVCYEGPERLFDFTKMTDTAIVSACELLAREETPTPESPTVVPTDEGPPRVEWTGLRL